MRPTHLLSIALACAVLGCATPPMNAARAAEAAALAAAGKAAAPAWLDGAVVYGVVPPLYGGALPLPATTRQLASLAKSGYDAVWLSPVNATDDPSAISYAVTDYKAVRADFGTRADFQALAAEAHARGLKVVIDFVPNHTSKAHPWFKAAKPGTAQWSWFMRDKDGTPQHYFDWEHLINLNFGEAAVRREMTEAFLFWAQEMGVDGFRVDAAWGIQQRTPGFWPELTAAVRKARPGTFFLAEAGARDAYWGKSGFDAAYDWTEDLGKWAWEPAFNEPARAGLHLRKAMAATGDPGHQVARFLNNNDTGARFVTRYGAPMQRAAAVLLHTVPGLPIVYMGEETGAEFEPYEDPPPLATTDKHKLRPLYAKLAGLRGELPALAKGAYADVPTGAPGALAFTRDAGGADVALVALNFGPKAELQLRLPARLRSDKARTLVDALTGERVAINAGQASLKLPAAKAQARLLVPGPGW